MVINIYNCLHLYDHCPAQDVVLSQPQKTLRCPPSPLTLNDCPGLFHHRAMLPVLELDKNGSYRAQSLCLASFRKSYVHKIHPWNFILPSLLQNNLNTYYICVCYIYNMHMCAPVYIYIFIYLYVLPSTSGKEPACQCRGCKGHRFHPWVGKIPWRRARQPTSVFFLACTA